jgi:hypothetical protein
MVAVAVAQGFASFAVIVVLLASNTAVCAGWAASPQARMACCAGGGDACPMHKSKSHGSAGKHAISQTQADACCAATEQQHSNQSAQAHTSVMSSAVLGAGVIVPVAIPALMTRDGWRTGVPNPAAPIPKHVLLSVFLV